eukprot:8672849-Alexandrium_andersonii.AAC.1
MAHHLGRVPQEVDRILAQVRLRSQECGGVRRRRPHPTAALLPLDEGGQAGAQHVRVAQAPAPDLALDVARGAGGD